MGRINMLLDFKCKHLKHSQDICKSKLRKALIHVYPDIFQTRKNLEYKRIEEREKQDQTICLARKIFNRADFFDIAPEVMTENATSVADWYGRLLTTIDRLSIGAAVRTLDENADSLKTLLKEKCHYYKSRMC